MVMTSRQLFAAAAAAVALSCAPPVAAMATLDSTVVGASCSLTTGEGTTTVPCESSGWSVMLQPGWSAQMVATVEYTYTDDGLPLDRPSWFQLDPFGLHNLSVDHEAGAVYVFTSREACRDESCRSWIDYTGAGFGPYVILDNDVPDMVSGSFVVTTGAENNTNPALGMNLWGRIYVTTWDMVFAVPEPGTWALLLVGLLSIGWWRRRAITTPPTALA